VQVCDVVGTVFPRIYLMERNLGFEENDKYPKTVKSNEYLIVQNKA
jgi:hypothetical protein